MKNSKVKGRVSLWMALLLLGSLALVSAPMGSAEVMPGVGVSYDETGVSMDDGTKIAQTVTLRCVRTGNANIPPPAAGADWNFDYGGNTGIAVENNEPGTTYANSSGGWIKWANVDLKGGVASYKLCIASNGTSRTFDVRVSKPGEGLAAAVSLGTLTATGLATNWTARWVRYPAASIAGQNPPFIHANANGYNPPAEETSWATIADSKLDGICDVYYVFPNADSQFFRLSLTLKEEPVAPAGPYEGNLVFNVAPAAAAVRLQNLATGATLAPAADGRSFDGVAPGTYGYIVSAAGYTPKIGVVDVTNAHTKDAPLFKNILLWPSVVSPPDTFDVSLSARPYDTALTVTSLDGQRAYQPEADGKTYRLERGFYRYGATADGHVPKMNQVLTVDKTKKVYVVLAPAGGVENRFEAEDIAPADRPGSIIRDGVQYAGGQAISLGGGADNRAVFSGVISEYAGIAEVKIRYSGVVSGYLNVKTNGETPRTVALDASGVAVVHTDVTNGSNSIRISAAPAGFLLDCIDVWSLATAGSVDPNEMDEPYVWTKNPIIKSIYTADPEAHVWPTDTGRLMLYPSHDRYPQAGCNRMDMYHVFSTRDLIHFEDQGEILRRNDLPSWAVKNTGLNADSFMWAPDAAYYDGYYYFYNPVPRQTGNWGATWETSVVRSIYPDKGFEQIPADDVDANPGKEWSGFIRDSGATDGYANMYDVCVRVYDDRIYMYNGAAQTLWQGELKSDMATVLGGRLTLVSTDNRTTANNQGDPDAYRRLPDYHEGPSAFRRNGIYYLIYPGSSGSYGGLSGDSFHYATSTGPLGPWTYRGIFFNPHGTGTSHGSVVEFGGEYYWVYHTGNMLPGSSDQTRSVCMDKLVFDDDATFSDGTKGAIVRFTRTFDGVPGLDGVDYEKPLGVRYGPAEGGAMTWGADVARTKNAAAQDGGWVLGNVGGAANAASAVTLTFDMEKAGRVRLRFHYATRSDMPRLNLTVNGLDYNTVHFPKTGGLSFFSDVEFTPRKLESGANTLVLGGVGAASGSQAGGSITLNYIEVIPLDEDTQTGIEIRRSGSHVSAINYNEAGSAPVGAKLILAVYDDKGGLLYADAKDVEVDPQRAETAVFDVDLSRYAGCTIQTFAWDPATYAPLDGRHTKITMHSEKELGKEQS